AGGDATGRLWPGIWLRLERLQHRRHRDADHLRPTARPRLCARDLLLHGAVRAAGDFHRRLQHDTQARRVRWLDFDPIQLNRIKVYFLFEHDLSRTPASIFRDHALGLDAGLYGGSGTASLRLEPLVVLRLAAVDDNRMAKIRDLAVAVE